MKVVIIHNDFRVYWRERLLYLRRFLQTENIELYAIEMFGKGSPYAFDVYTNTEKWWVCLFPENNSDELSKKGIAQAAFSALDDIKPDVIIAPSIVFFPGALGIRWAKKNNRKFIMFDDALPHQVKRPAIVQWIKNLITIQADGFWFPIKDYYDSYRFLHKKNNHFFYGFSAINNAMFRPATPNPMTHKTIICVARLVPVKNLTRLVNAWQEIEKEATGYRLVIVGDGPEYDNLTRLKAQLGLTTIDFLGALDNNMLAGYYHNADAFILPSLSESWGLVVNEAMAAGLPVILSRQINAANYLLKEDVNGFGFSPLDECEIVGVITSFIRLDIDAKKMMAENSLKIIDTMNFEKMGHQLVEALSIIQKQKPNNPSPLARVIINHWYGRYNTTGWNKQ